MDHDREFHFLYTVLQKNHIRVLLLEKDDIQSEKIVDISYPAFNNLLQPTDADIHTMLCKAEERTLYYATDKLGRKFIFLFIPHTDGKTMLLIGPYLSTQKTQAEILAIQEALGIAAGKNKQFYEYYSSLPLIAPGSPILSMIDTFCELIWDTRSFSIVNGSEIQLSPTQLKKGDQSDNFEDIIDGMQIMEARYAFESELMDAVEHGQIQRENELLSSFSDKDFFEKRTQDPLRNIKNYCIIMNTLLRKAAQKGGVHPVYINEASSTFAHKIEKMVSADECKSMMCEMFRAYCRLVRKHSMQGFSLAVQKAVITIDNDISANLSLSALASMQGMSPGYLSAIFKRDTGKTVSEYIRDRRIHHAQQLLATTQLQIQTVALHCGIMDLQYFSKIFKKQTGMTPKDYREMSTRRKTT